MMPASGPDLRDIHLPPAPGWWPLAPGWWLLLALLLLAVALLAWRLVRRRPWRRRWRAVDRELDALLARHVADRDNAALTAGVSQLLRRVARLRDASAPSLHGEAWQATLRRLAPEGLEMRALLALETSIYQPQPALDADALARTARSWLRHVLLRGRAHA